MKIAGKLPPEKKKFEKLYNEGFDHFELYLTETQLENNSADEIIEVCQDSAGQIVSVHTPHIEADTDPRPYFRQADEIAAKLSAVLIFDSNPIGTRYAPKVYPSSDAVAETVGYENDPSVSKYYLRNFHLSNEHSLVLDTAHIHMSEETYLPFIEALLQNYSVNEVPVIHLADGTRQNDGVPLGEGTVNIKAIVDLLETYEYSGPVVLEVMPSKQPEALQKIHSFIDK
ncbi:MAG: sugar phosphate isomerase/epimerase family protein [Candidatus Nanohalobium sp.]